MCLDRDAYLSHIVYRKLVARGVEHERAAAVSRKIQERALAVRRKAS
jgi:hypothetical protein